MTTEILMEEDRGNIKKLANLYLFLAVPQKISQELPKQRIYMLLEQGS